MYLSFIRFSRYSRSLPKKAMDSIYFSTEVSCPVGFTGGSLVKNTSANVEDTDLIPGSGRSLGEGTGNPLQYSCLENSMNRGVWWTTVHGAAKSQT